MNYFTSAATSLSPSLPLGLFLKLSPVPLAKSYALLPRPKRSAPLSNMILPLLEGLLPIRPWASSTLQFGINLIDLRQRYNGQTKGGPINRGVTRGHYRLAADGR